MFYFFAAGVTRDFTIERIDWPFKLEDIHSPKVLVFHGEENGGDSAYVELPNGAGMMIDCGCGDNHWSSTLLKKYDITQNNPVQIPSESESYGLHLSRAFSG